MLINIPINVDEELFNRAVEKDYNDKVLREIVKRIESALSKKAKYYYGKPEDGLLVLINERIDSILKDNKDLIIERASDKLAERLARSKKGKEILDGLSS